MLPSGQQFELVWGTDRATVVEVGGGIREYWHGTRAVLEGYPADALCDGGHGAPLVPWPSRVADGQYAWEGQTYQLDWSEPEKHNAIHGLLRWRPWQATARQGHRVRMATRLYPEPGYPFCLDVAVTYSLGPEGLRVHMEVSNQGDRPCPLAVGQHPYLSPGSGRVDDAVLSVPAARRIVTDPTRQLPTGIEDVAGTAWDFRHGRRIGTQALDDCFTGFDRDDQGRATIRLTGTDGKTACLWMDGSFSVAAVYSGDTLALPRRRLGLAAEPMTAPPNALATGDGVVTLAPGAAWTGEWGARLLDGER